MLPPVPERQPESITLLERTEKSGGSSTFYYIEKGAATTLCPPVHRDFSRKGGSSGSSFAKLWEGAKSSTKKIKIILADAGYREKIADKTKTTFGYILEVVVSGDKVNGFKPIGKRWMAERTFSWFGNYRRLCRNYEWTFDSAEEMMVKTASIEMLLNKIKTSSYNPFNFASFQIASISFNVIFFRFFPCLMVCSSK